MSNNASPSPDRIVSLAEAAQIAGIGFRTLMRVRDRGELRVVRLTERRVGVRMSDLQAWIAGREVAA
jgi:predicted DNA-binding transcriptional regulator AlpA